MKKICLVIHSLGIGGMERVMAQLANNFASRPNVKVHIILIGKKRQVVFKLSDLIKVYKPSFSFSNNRRKIDTIRTIRFLRLTVKKINPDTVLSFGEMWNNLVLLALRGFNIPIFISDRSEPGKDLGKLHNFLRNQLYPSATGYIAQTQKAKEICLSKGWNSNVQAIGNPIREMASDNHTTKENIVLSVGRLIKTKHFDQLIRMFVDIGDPDWKLVIVGGDAKKQQLFEELKKLIYELRAENRIFLEGEQKEIESYYKRSKIFAFTSSSEGFPNVIGEALSAGLPVVSYDCMAGPSDMIIDGENGYLVPLFNQEMFKDRLVKLMGSKDLRKRLGKSGQLKVKDFNVERVAEQFYQFMVGKGKNHKQQHPAINNENYYKRSINF